jgi:hypothetical protein
MVAGVVPSTTTGLRGVAKTQKWLEKLLPPAADSVPVAAPDQATITAGYIAVLKANKGNGPLTYLSTPITGGQRKYEFLAQREKTSKAELSEPESREFARDVIGYNTEMAKGVAECLQGNPENGVVVNPGTLNVPGWTQRDYLNHWLAVVKEVADKVVLVPGWQFSKGCVYEAREALNKGIPVQEIQITDLDRTSAQARVDQAVEMLETTGFEKDATMGDILNTQGFHEEWYLNHA